MVKSAHCNMQRFLSIFVFLWTCLKRDQLLNLFPNKMLTYMRTLNVVKFRNFINPAYRRRSLWGNHNDLTDLSPLTKEKRKLYRLSDTKLKTRWAVYITVTSLVTTMGKEVLNVENFAALDVLMHCGQVNIFSVMSHFPIYMGWFVWFDS